MRLHIVVRHARQPDQRWANQWVPDNRGLTDFTTPNSVVSEVHAADCAHVHSCGFGSDAQPPCVRPSSRRYPPWTSATALSNSACSACSTPWTPVPRRRPGQGQNHPSLRA